MIKANAKKPAIVIISVLLILVTATPAFAWFANLGSYQSDNTGESILSYFAAGTGVDGDPFIITEQKHLYHLAWLQNLGLLQDEKYYFMLGEDINMLGLAMPPIGTEQYPFIGDFNGNNKVISNLRISNIENEIKYYHRNPDLGSRVGFFGKIDSPDSTYNPDTAGKAYNFYLENMSVSNGAGNAAIGIVAGHNNGHLSNIGVSNNSFKLGADLMTKSDYVLIGELGPDVDWLDSPNYFGNKILINPNNPLFGGLSSSSTPPYMKVPNSTDEHAYMTAALATLDSHANYFFKVDATTTSYPDGILTLTPSTTTAITGTNYSDKGIPEELWTLYSTARAENDKVRFITPQNPPNYTSPQSIPLKDGSTLQIPKNGIWFNPKGSGTCGMAFAITNQSKDSAMSLYKFRRGTNGAIIDWSETRYVLKPKIYGNKAVLYFDFEVEKGWEYVLGRSTNNSLFPNVAGFFYLVLHGVGNQGPGMENKSTMFRIDYVMRDENNLFPDLSAANYQFNRTFLSFAGTSTTGGNMYFNKTTYNQKTAVYYYCTASPLTIMENVFDDPHSFPADAYTTAIFPDWMSQYP
jgi:hypothetical protein